MQSLNEIGIKHGTDKSSEIHNFLEFYDRRLGYLRDKSFTLFEVGVYFGASVRTWKEFFPKAQIVGLDINPDTKKHEEERISVRLGDQSSVKFLFDVIKEFGQPLVVVDDGSHQWDHQIQTLNILLPFVQAGGHYIIEDLHTSSEHMRGEFQGNSKITAVDYLNHFAKLVCLHDVAGPSEIYDNFIHANYSDIYSVEIARRTAMINKK